jgi:hypothetical protein
MRFHGWFPRSSHELTARTTKCEEKYTSSWYPTKPPPPPDINKKATRRPWVAQPFICLEFHSLATYEL